MEIKNIITQELFDSLNIVKGDLNLSYVLREKIKIKELSGIVNECRKLYRKLIDNYLDKDIYDYETMIYYSPQYKIYQETNSTNIFIFVVTPVGKCGLIQITNSNNKNSKPIKSKCLI